MKIFSFQYLAIVAAVFSYQRTSSGNFLFGVTAQECSAMNNGNSQDCEDSIPPSEDCCVKHPNKNLCVEVDCKVRNAVKKFLDPDLMKKEQEDQEQKRKKQARKQRRLQTIPGCTTTTSGTTTTTTTTTTTEPENTSTEPQRQLDPCDCTTTTSGTTTTTTTTTTTEPESTSTEPQRRLDPCCACTTSTTSDTTTSTTTTSSATSTTTEADTTTTCFCPTPAPTIPSTPVPVSKACKSCTKPPKSSKAPKTKRTRALKGGSKGVDNPSPLTVCEEAYNGLAVIDGTSCTPDSVCDDDLTEINEIRFLYVGSIVATSIKVSNPQPAPTPPEMDTFDDVPPNDEIVVSATQFNEPVTVLVTRSDATSCTAEFDGVFVGAVDSDCIDIVVSGFKTQACDFDDGKSTCSCS